MLDDLPPGGPPPHITDVGGDMYSESHTIHSAAVWATRMPMLVTNPRLEDNPIVWVNPAFVHMSGYSEDELLGHNCRLMQGPETDKNTLVMIREALDATQEISVEILNYKKNGSSFWNALYIAPVLDHTGKLIYFFASQLDVTRRRDAEEALRQSQKMEAVGQLTGGIAHDFNNLLTVVQGFSELLEDSLKSENFNKARAMRSVDAIIQATNRGVKLTSQLLAFARKQKLEGRVVNLLSLVDQLEPLIAQSVGDGIKLNISHDPSQCNVRVDIVQAELALINIAVNARDAMDGRGLLTIKTGTIDIEREVGYFSDADTGTYSYISLTDTGTGMDSETLARIAEPFFTTKQEGKGTGLGMSMVHGFIKQSGALMRITSEVGLGTTVNLYFKCEQAVIDVPVVHAQSNLEGRQGDKELILVVEDRHDVANYVDLLLTDFGYTTIRAENAEMALKILESRSDIDLMFSDVVMPGTMNGVGLAREVTKHYPLVKILLTTGFTNSLTVTSDGLGTSFEVINKPYKRVDLLRKIRQVLNGPDGVS